MVPAHLIRRRGLRGNQCPCMAPLQRWLALCPHLVVDGTPELANRLPAAGVFHPSRVPVWQTLYATACVCTADNFSSVSRTFQSTVSTNSVSLRAGSSH